MRGRKPKPTMLKELAGNPGGRPLNAREPKPDGDLSAAPNWFTPSQRDGWDYAIANAPPRLLRKIDRSVLTVWVVAEDLHRDATLKLFQMTPSLLVKVSIGKKDVTPDQYAQSPYLPIINRQAGIMLKAAEQLGFSPAARPRLQVPPPSPNEQRDPGTVASGIEAFEAFLADDPDAPTAH